MRLQRPLAAFVAACALAFGAAGPGRAAAQQPGIKRDVPQPVAGSCSTIALVPVQAVEQDPDEAARLAASAREASLLGQPRTARDLLERAVAVDTSSASHAFLFARTLEELGEVNAAAREYCRYLVLVPDAPDAAEVRQLVGRIAPAVRPGIPDSAVARFQEGIALVDGGRNADAEAAFSAVIASAPSWAPPYYNRAVLRAQGNRREEARADLDQYLLLESDASDATSVRDWRARLAAPFRSYSPGAAFGLGLIPGGGHFYTRRPLVGTTLLVVAGGAAAFGALYERRSIECLTIPQGNVCPPDQIRSDDVERPYLVPAAAVAATMTLIGAIDAARGARQHNERGAAAAQAGRLGDAVRVRPSRVDVALFRLRF
ncbi:MAG TPA: hypothetical protein VK912_07400 [Longimicrobiales bacterium]|nr:hypothetical protein [Longimicrobiales bacterium]